MKIIIRMQKPLITTDENIKTLIHPEIKRLGVNADLNHIDVSQVTDMTSLFENTQFNGDISKWNVSNVLSMYSMFGSSKFNSDISKWDVTNVNDMIGMFKDSQFNMDISKWNVSNVVNMWEIFKNSKFNGDISDWKPNQGIKIGRDIGPILERSYQIKAEKESALMKNEISKMTKRNSKSL